MFDTIYERNDDLTSAEFRNNPLFLRNQFLSDGTFEMPKIKKEEIDLENVELVGYDKLSSSNSNQIVHFFLDDYKFEAMWKDPSPRIERLNAHKAVLSPNFSVYTEMPVAMKIYNTFRSRWCGAFLQSNGIKVIPTLAWGGPETFWFCFDGIEQKSVVAIPTLGVRTEKDLFMQGYYEMIRRIKPSKIICYGKPFPEMKGNIIEIDYAETNNFEKSFNDNSILPNEKGMGSAAPPKNKLPSNDAQIKHILRKAEGHIEDTPENRALLESVANNSENYKGTDMHGNRWYSKTLPDGKQIWVYVKNGIIQNGGINNSPRPWDNDTGYNRNTKGFDIMNDKYIKKAFLALFHFIENEYFKTKNDSLGVMASSMNPHIFADGNSADPAYYSDFCAFIKKYDSENVKSSYNASIDFLMFYHTEFEFQIKEYIDKLTLEEYSKYFNNTDNKTGENIEQYKI